MRNRLQVMAIFLVPFLVAGAAALADGYVGIKIRLTDGKVLIEEVLGEDSPAAKAGLKEGDRILKVGDTEATDLKTTVDAIRESKVGEEVKFKIEREGQEKEIKVKIGERPQ